MKTYNIIRSVTTLFIVSCLVACSAESTITNESFVETTLADYQRAEQFLAANTNDLILNNILAQYWQADNQLIYRRSTIDGSDYVLVDIETAEKNNLLDSSRLSDELAIFSDEDFEANDLNLSRLALNSEDNHLEFAFEGNNYSLDLGNYELNQIADKPVNEFLSPNGLLAAYIDNFNLWVRDTNTDELTQLTFDGEENYGYATNNAGWIRDEGPVLRWSPDSTKIATFRQDARNVEEMYLYTTEVGHVELDAWKYPLPGDDYIFMIERIVIHLDELPNEVSPRLVKLDMPPDPQRSTTTDHIAGRNGDFLDVEWSNDSANLSFISSSRDHKIAQLQLANPETGEVRPVYKEEVATYYESGYDAENWVVFPERNEFIWFSEQTNWGHLYMHDLQTGELKQQITHGSWAVLQIQQIDLDNEQIYFLGSNKEEGDPYFQYLYRINFDGSNLVNLTPEIANHQINWSESADYFTDVYSTPTTAPVSVLRNKSGEALLILEEADITLLVGSGWIAPEPFIVKARDQVTDIHGLLYKPSTFDENQSYPILNYLYPGPQSGSVGTRSFRASRNDKQAVAELGFIVVELDAMGTPGRSKSFHDAYYGDMGDNGIPDQIEGIRQLASENAWMDSGRVGIWGHSGGGFASTAAILRYPDFYKVAVSGAGNHDNRNYEDDWGEKWQGLLERFPESNPEEAQTATTVMRTNYDGQANQLLVENLQGKLLLGHGMLDTNVHPSNTLLVVEALIDADKDFDLVILPNANHGFGNRRYFMKRRWDYFVENLKGSKPPEDFQFSDNIR